MLLPNAACTPGKVADLADRNGDLAIVRVQERNMSFPGSSSSSAG